MAGVQILIRVGLLEFTTHSGRAGNFTWSQDLSREGEVVQVTVREAGFLPWQLTWDLRANETPFRIRLEPEAERGTDPLKQPQIRFRHPDRPPEAKRGNIRELRHEQDQDRLQFWLDPKDPNERNIPVARLHPTVQEKDLREGQAVEAMGREDIEGLFWADSVREVEKSAPDPGRDVDRCLSAVESHPEYPALLNVKPSAIGYKLGAAVAALFCVAITAGVGAVLAFSDRARPAGELFYVVDFLFVIVGVLGALYFLSRLLAKLEIFPALVIDKSSATSFGSSSSHHYYVTMQCKGAKRRTFEAGRKLWDEIARDDIGVAYARHRRLFDYRRLSL